MPDRELNLQLERMIVSRGKVSILMMPHEVSSDLDTVLQFCIQLEIMTQRGNQSPKQNGAGRNRQRKIGGLVMDVLWP